jgi:glycosyl transferase family 25
MNVIDTSSIFDHVYVINLDRRSDRWKSVTKQLNQININPIRWKAVDCKDPTFTYDKSIKRKPGEIACYQSHRTLWEYLYSIDIPYAIIFEDDLAITKNTSKRLITNLLEKSAGFDVFLLGHCYGKKCSKENGSCIGYGKCLHAYVVSRNGLKVLLDQKVDYNTPIDNMVDILCKKNELTCFIAYSDSDKDFSTMEDDGIIFQSIEFNSDNPK